MKESVKNEKARIAGETETQASTSVNSLEINNKLWEAVCPCPVTPGGCYDSDSFKAGGYGLTVMFTDHNDFKLRSKPSEMRLLIDGDFNENASNRILACLSFFKWNGQEYIPCSLIGDHDDLRHVVLGNITEIEAEPLITTVEELTERLEAHKLAEKGVIK